MTYAMVFPGQGSQSVGMLAELASAPQSKTLVKSVFDEASDALNYDLWDVVSEGPVERLNQTAITQPAILTASTALWRLWCEHTDSRPLVVAGHSLGEYSALVAADVLEFSAAVKLVARRGELMQAAVPADAGAMAAILGLEDDAVKQACLDAAEEDIVEAVNFNAPGQVVIAGDRAAVERATEKAKAAGARRAQILPVSVPAHSSLMKPAAQQFAQDLADVALQDGAIEIIHNVGLDSVADGREALLAQLYSPVPWTDVVRLIAERQVSRVLECGPGKILGGLGKRIKRDLVHLPMQTPDDFAAALEAVVVSSQSSIDEKTKEEV